MKTTDLIALVEKGYWIQVSPLARVNPTEWIVAIYMRMDHAWVTDKCKSGFDNAESAYEWGFDEIRKTIEWKNTTGRKF